MSLVRKKKEVVSFSLDEKAKLILDVFVNENKISKSKLINKMIIKMDSMGLFKDIEKIDRYLVIEKL